MVAQRVAQIGSSKSSSIW